MCLISLSTISTVTSVAECGTIVVLEYPDYWEARLPDAGGMVSSQDIRILLFSWRAATAEFCSVLAELSASSQAQDLSSVNTLLKGSPL